MDYENKYRELLARLQKAKENEEVNDERYCCVIDGIVPELKEDEDELTWLKNYISEEAYYLSMDIRDNKDSIKLQKLQKSLAWLEKQGEQKPNPYSGTSFEYNGHTWGMCARDNGVEILIDSEIKAFISPEKSFIYPTPLQHNGTSKVGLATEAIKEEKVDNANKAEPKFKVGDWVVKKSGKNFHNGSKTIQFTKTDENACQFGSIRRLYEDKIRHWTIADAKDGDILVSATNKPFIYNGWFNNISIGAYCGLGFNDEFMIADEQCNWTCNHNIKPATKEQSDLLSQKLKEAGYGIG